MPLQVSSGAALACTFGLSPGVLTVLPPPARPVVATAPAANVTDFVPLTNIASFGMCTSPANPAVAAATAAAAGTPTPAPCVPATTSPWTPGSLSVLIANQPALHNACQCQCTWGGTISVTVAGQMPVTIT